MYDLVFSMPLVICLIRFNLAKSLFYAIRLNWFWDSAQKCEFSFPRMHAIDNKKSTVDMVMKKRQGKKSHDNFSMDKAWKFSLVNRLNQNITARTMSFWDQKIFKRTRNANLIAEEFVKTTRVFFLNGKQPTKKRFGSWIDICF